MILISRLPTTTQEITRKLWKESEDDEIQRMNYIHCRVGIIRLDLYRTWLGMAKLMKWIEINLEFIVKIIRFTEDNHSYFNCFCLFVQ